MQEFPLSKLKIKLRGKDNPTSVFKKRSFLSLNCINNKSLKSKSPLRVLTGEELPHYILPIKCHLNKTENNEKDKIKKKDKKQKIKLTIFSRNKSDLEINTKQNFEEKNNCNKENNIYNTINFNKSNLNTNYFVNSHPINDYSSSNKDNNEKIISELNIINNQNNNQNNNINNNSFEEPLNNPLISELQKKINEQNDLLSTRKKEIEELKLQISNNNKQYIELNNENEKEKNEIKKLEEEINSLKKNLEELNNKYQTELNNKKQIEEKYKFLKDNMKEHSLKEKDINKYEDKIIEQENKIISLEEELNELKNIKNKNHKISTESKFEIISTIKKNLILTQKKYQDIQLILNVLLDKNKIEQKNLWEQVIGAQSQFPNMEKLSNEICSKLKLKIKEKNINIIKYYINDFIIKSKKQNNNDESELEKLFKYKFENDNKNNGIYLMTDLKYKKIIYEKCKKFDFKNKHKIPFYYFKHIYKEICYKNKKSFSSDEFYNLLYECKNINSDVLYSLDDILYENLNKEINDIKINFDYKLKYPDLVKNFLDKIIKEAYDKKKENSGNNQINRARSFEQDFFEQSILDNKSSNNKINLDD